MFAEPHGEGGDQTLWCVVDRVVPGFDLDQPLGDVRRQIVEHERSSRAQAHGLACLADVVEGSFDENLAPIEDDHAIGDALGLVEFMSGEHDSTAAFGERGDDRSNGVASVDVDAARGFVEEHHVGSADQREGERQSLLFTAGQASPRGASPVAEADHLDEFVGHGAPADPMDAAILTDDVDRAGRRVDTTFLQHQPGSSGESAAVPSGSGRIESEYPDIARRASSETLAHLDGARLPRSVRAENRSHLAGARRERDSVDRGDGACTASVPHGEIADLDDVVDRTRDDAGTEDRRRIGARGHLIEVSAAESSPVRPRR